MSSEAHVSFHVDTDTVWSQGIFHEIAVFLVTGQCQSDATVSQLFRKILSSNLFLKDHCTAERARETFILKFVANISHNPGLKNEAESVIRQALTQAGFLIQNHQCTIS